jgi:hypothetical protein
MANRGKDKNRVDALLGKLPTGAKRVKVIDETGKQRYRDVGDLAVGDEIQINSKGIPIVMMGKPGRKRSVELRPANETVAAIIQEKEGVIDTDPILTKAKSDPESPDVLQEIINALGEEQASILFERIQAERRGEETSQLSGRRVAALKTMGDVWLKRKEQLVTRGVDLESPGFKTVFEFIMVTFQEAMAGSNVRSEIIESVFAKVSREVDSDQWAAEAKRRMKSVV